MTLNFCSTSQKSNEPPSEDMRPPSTFPTTLRYPSLSKTSVSSKQSACTAVSVIVMPIPLCITYVRPKKDPAFNQLVNYAG